MTLPAAICNLLMDSLADHLSAALMTNVTDDAKAGLVRCGKLQDDPTIGEINLLIHPGYEAWPHVLNRDAEGPGMNAPTYEIGSEDGLMPQFFRRRFRVELKLFFDGELERDTARRKADAVLARLEHAILTTPLPPPDDFGESAYMVGIDKSHLYEGGGEGTFIWRGSVWLEFMTQKQ